MRKLWKDPELKAVVGKQVTKQVATPSCEPHMRLQTSHVRLKTSHVRLKTSQCNLNASSTTPHVRLKTSVCHCQTDVLSLTWGCCNLFGVVKQMFWASHEGVATSLPLSNRCFEPHMRVLQPLCNIVKKTVLHSVAKLVKKLHGPFSFRQTGGAASAVFCHVPLFAL